MTTPLDPPPPSSIHPGAKTGRLWQLDERGSSPSSFSKRRIGQSVQRRSSGHLLRVAKFTTLLGLLLLMLYPILYGVQQVSSLERQFADMRVPQLLPATTRLGFEPSELSLAMASLGHTRHRPLVPQAIFSTGMPYAVLTLELPPGIHDRMVELKLGHPDGQILWRQQQSGDHGTVQMLISPNLIGEGMFGVYLVPENGEGQAPQYEAWFRIERAAQS